MTSVMKRVSSIESPFTSFTIEEARSIGNSVLNPPTSCLILLRDGLIIALYLSMK